MIDFQWISETIKDFDKKLNTYLRCCKQFYLLLLYTWTLYFFSYFCLSIDHYTLSNQNVVGFLPKRRHPIQCLLLTWVPWSRWTRTGILFLQMAFQTLCANEPNRNLKGKRIECYMFVCNGYISYIRHVCKETESLPIATLAEQLRKRQWDRSWSGRSINTESWLNACFAHNKGNANLIIP